MRHMKALVALLIAAIAVAAGCIGQVSPTGQVTNPPATPETPEQPEQPSAEEPVAEPPEGPAIELITPMDGQVFEGTTSVGVRVEVASIKLVGPKPVNAEGQGHIYAYLERDGAKYKEQRQVSKVFSFGGVAPGDYMLVVELANNDKTSREPPVRDSARITLK